MSFHFPHPIVSLIDIISRSRRPRLLLRTARIGLHDYRRETDLRRVLRLPAAPAPGVETLRALIDLEAALEANRLRPAQGIGDTWRPARHVEVMIALMAEAQLLAASVSAPPSATRRMTLARGK